MAGRAGVFAWAMCGAAKADNILAADVAFLQVIVLSEPDIS